MKIDLQLQGNAIAVRVWSPETRTKGGLELPQVAQRAIPIGNVFMVGPDAPKELLGKNVLFKQYHGVQLPEPLMDDNEVVLILEPKHILGMVTEKDDSDTPNSTEGAING